MAGPRHRRRPWQTAALAAAALAAGGTPSAGGDPCLAAFVAQRSPFATDDVVKVDRGDVVLDDLPAAGPRQVGIVGMMRVRASIGAVRDSLAAVRPLISGEYLEGFGLLGEEPAAEDLGGYHVPESDIAALWSCVPGDCHVKITLELLRRLGSLPWRGRNPPAGIDEAFRRWMAGYVAEYRRRGRDALVVFHDKRSPQSLDEGFGEVVRASEVLSVDLPELRDYMVEYPAVAVPGVSDRFSWSLQDFGLRPTTILSHTAVLDRPGSVPQTVIVRKQLYATHYLHAALTVVALVEGSEADGPATYLMAYDHYLFDDDVGMVRRLLATRRLRGYLGRRLEALRAGIEAGPAPAAADDAPSPDSARACPFVAGSP